jgi:hypothetical protein
MTAARYDSIRGGAIWNERMKRDDGQEIAWAMVQALRELARGEDQTDWQTRTLELTFNPMQVPPTPGDVMWFVVACNVLIEMKDDFTAQVKEARARGEQVAAP